MTSVSDQQPNEAWTFIDWCEATAFYHPDQSIAHHHRLFQEATASLDQRLAFEISSDKFGKWLRGEPINLRADALCAIGVLRQFARTKNRLVLNGINLVNHARLFLRSTAVCAQPFAELTPEEVDQLQIDSVFYASTDMSETLSELYQRVFPSPSQRIWGRDHDMSQLLTMLSDRQHPIVCISGTAGDGKTNLAWWAMRRAVEEGLFTHFDWVTDRSMYVDSNGEPRPTGLPALHTDSIFNSMIKHFSWDELKLRATNIASQCAQRFREGHYCLVLDNMETQGQLEHFLRALSVLVHPKVPRTSRILITSRVEYPTMNVKFMPIKGLALESVIAYIKYVEKSQNNVRLTDNERQLLAKATDGNPLFIQIAIARYARAQTHQDMRELIAHIQKGDRFYKAFQNLFGGLYDALSAAAQQIALDAAIYSEKITQEDLLSDAAMHTEDEDIFEQALAELVDQRVLVASNVRGQYTMHPLIRAYLTRVKSTS